MTIKGLHIERFIREKDDSFKMKPVNLTPHKSEDKIVVDAIKAVNYLKEEKQLKGRIGGGMAVQSYIPSELHRLTIDLDVSLLWHGGAPEFKELSKPLIDYLKANNYQVNLQKKGFAYEFIFNKGTKDSFMIQHPKYSKNYFERNKKSLEREIENERILSKKDVSFSVLSPEDLMVGKLNRAIIFSKEYGISAPKDVSLENLKKESERLREGVVSRFSEVSPREVALLRLVNDCYDIQCLNDSVGLNKNYFNEVVKDWKSSKTSVYSFYRLLDKFGVSPI